MYKYVLGLLLAIGAAFAVNPSATEAESSTLFGVDMDAGSLVTIDLVDASVATVGLLGPGFRDVEGLAFGPDGTLFGTHFRVGDPSDTLVTIDTATGAATAVGFIGFKEVQGLAVSPEGTLFGVESLGCSCLIRIDPSTGASVVVGSLGFTEVVGLDFSPDGTLFGVQGIRVAGSSSKLLRIDPSSGAATFIGEIGFAGIQSIAFAPDGTLFGVGGVGSSNVLIKIDPETGAGTLVGPMSGGLIHGIDFARPSALTVQIDIEPGSFPNSINPQSRGVIPVAIVTTDTFDATTVDPTTVLFGRTGTEAAPVQSAPEDVDGDGDTDMILHFKTQDTGIQCGDISAFLTGETLDGQMIEGSDSIKTRGCK